MKKFLSSGAWVFVFILLYYGGIPLYMLATDKAEKQYVTMNSRNQIVFVEHDTKHIRIPAGGTPSVLFEQNGRVYRKTFLPPARFMPGTTVTREASESEKETYERIF